MGTYTEEYVTYKVPSKLKMERYRRDVARQKKTDEEKDQKKRHYRQFLGTWMVVVCPSDHFSVVPHGTRFHCDTCDKNYTVRLFPTEERKSPNPEGYWFKGDWRETDGYWYKKNWKKASIFQKGLSEEEARQLLLKLTKGSDHDTR
jgi:ferredoxin-like protein FixX